MKTIAWVGIGVVVVIAFLALIIGVWWAGTYNSLVSNDESVNKAWGNVEATYQRRVDLIPNLVATVQGAANFEKSTILAVTEARSRWQGATTVDQKIAAANQVEGAIGRLLVTVEAYPDLKATQNFLALQDQLEGTENRISVARQDYNNAVQAYNTKVRSFPANFIAGMYGFDQKKAFEATAGAENAPKVAFT
jgi:LemA protein